MSDERERDNEDAGARGRPAAEWITLGISVAVIAGILGLVTWLYVRGTEAPPTIAVEAMLDDVRDVDGDWYLPIEVRNDGDRTVASAIIEGELDTGSGQPETAQVTIDYLAGNERVRGTFVFSSDPRDGELSVGPTSYQDP